MSLFKLKRVTWGIDEIPKFSVDCSSLTHEDSDAIAHIIASKTKFYGVVAATKSTKLVANKLENYIDDTSDIFLVIDEVGIWLDTVKQQLEDEGIKNLLGIILFNLTENRPHWSIPLFNLNL